MKVEPNIALNVPGFNRFSTDSFANKDLIFSRIKHYTHFLIVVFLIYFIVMVFVRYYSYLEILQII